MFGFYNLFYILNILTTVIGSPNGFIGYVLGGFPASLFLLALVNINNCTNLVSLNPPGHFLVLKAYMVAHIINKNGKNKPIMKVWSTPTNIYLDYIVG